MVATAVLELVDDGGLSLDDTLAKFVTRVANGDQITVRHLLSMSSGVWNYTTGRTPVDTSRWRRRRREPSTRTSI